MYPVTCLVKRLSDGYTTTYSNNDFKKYNALDKSFLNLPNAVLDIIKGESLEIDAITMNILQKYDDFSLPPNQPLNLPTLKPENFEEQTKNSPDLELHNISSTHEDLQSTDIQQTDIQDSDNGQTKSLISPPNVEQLQNNTNSSVSQQNQTVHSDNTVEENSVHTPEQDHPETNSPNTHTNSTHQPQNNEDSSDEEIQDNNPMILRSGKQVTFKQ